MSRHQSLQILCCLKQLYWFDINVYICDWMQDCGNSNVLVTEIPQSCIEPFNHRCPYHIISAIRYLPYLSYSYYIVLWFYSMQQWHIHHISLAFWREKSNYDNVIAFEMKCGVNRIWWQYRSTLVEWCKQLVSEGDQRTLQMYWKPHILGS